MEASDSAFDATALARLPLSQAVFAISRFVLEPTALDDIYKRHRGRSYAKILDFSDMVDLIGQSLLGPEASVRANLLAVEEREELPTTTRAVYDKLSRIPVDVSQAFLTECSARLRELVPTEWNDMPASLKAFTGVVLDGKVVKHVPRHLLPLRIDRLNATKLLGGRALVAFDRGSGLVLGFHGHPDGEANDIRFVPEVLQMLKGRVERPLFIGDRAFGTVEQALRFRAQGDFLLRLHGGTPWERDMEKPEQNSVDRFGREVREDWGWIVRGEGRKQVRVSVRRITVRRDKESLVLITSLEDAECYPANDLLDAYMDRWLIENMFQEITEVFDLRRLIGTSPQATLFQLAYCMLIYNIIRVVKHIVARGAQQRVDDVSSEMLFRDVRAQLTAALLMLSSTRLAELIPTFATADELRRWLEELLEGCWRPRWKKANRKQRDPSRPVRERPKKLKQTKGHDSVHRILEKQKQ